MEQHAREKAGFKQFKAIKPKAVSLPQGELVTTGYLQPGQRLPLVVQPGLEGLDLAEWAGANAAYLEGELLKHGAVLFRGFGVSEPPVLERFASALCANLFEDNGEHPHISLSGKVYTPVFYPAHKKLLWHSENSFNYQWPLRIWFACARPAAQGGETPVVDNRRLYEALPAELRERFERKGVMYLRNYGEGLGRNWQEVFRTNSRAEVEAACRVSGMEFEWLPNDRLRTRCVRPAAIRHPRTGEVCWFNQAQHWHVSCLDPDTGESLKSMFAEEDLPRNCYYGDGSPIADETMAAILDLYARLETSFPWQLGDVMLVDNVLAAHGRNAFSGERKILVALGEMTNYE